MWITELNHIVSFSLSMYIYILFENESKWEIIKLANIARSQRGTQWEDQCTEE